jgi:hypothetical protein
MRHQNSRFFSRCEQLGNFSTTEHFPKQPIRYRDVQGPLKYPLADRCLNLVPATAIPLSNYRLLRCLALFVDYNSGDGKICFWGNRREIIQRELPIYRYTKCRDVEEKYKYIEY